MRKLEEVVAEILKEPVTAVSDVTSPNTVSSWDSLRHIELVMAIEKTYDITFELSEVMTITSVGAVRDLLQQKGVPA